MKTLIGYTFAVRADIKETTENKVDKALHVARIGCRMMRFGRVSIVVAHGYKDLGIFVRPSYETPSAPLEEFMRSTRREQLDRASMALATFPNHPLAEVLISEIRAEERYWAK